MSRVRRMLSEDADRAAQIAAAFPDAWTKKDFEDSLMREEALLLAAEDDGDAYPADASKAVADCGAGGILGFVIVYVSPDEAEIVDVAVDREHQGKGVGRLLLKETIHELKCRGISRLVLEVREGNAPARALYGSCGFSELGIRKNFYSAPKESAVIMELNI